MEERDLWSSGASEDDADVLRIGLLTGFRVSVGPRAVPDSQWHLRKAKALVKLLALAPGHRLHREQLMDLLWPQSDSDAASINLRYALHVARRALATVSPVASACLRTEGEQVVLRCDGTLEIDVEEFESAAASARGRHDPAPYRRAIRLYTGDLLPEDRYEEWAERRREQLRRTYVDLVLALSSLHEERGELGQAIEDLRLVVATEPTHEEAHTELMRLYALSGERQRAVQQYDELRRALRELDEEPSATSRRMYEDVAAGRIPGGTQLQPSTPSVATSPAQRHNLPVQLTSLVGREKEIEEVERLLKTTRLLTLTGAGGSGKTRLALEAASGLVAEYPDGVWLVELAPLSDPELVPQAVARIVGVREQPGLPMKETLITALSSRRLLLVLDNCEHLLDAAAGISDTLLRGCPHLRLLATSREPLGTQAEKSWVVPTLSTPTKPLPADRLAQYESVQLFLERASRHAGFRLTPDNALAVAEICNRLEGMPLALELAAARVRSLSAPQIAARLDDELNLLVGGARTAAPRHQTLRATLDWSFQQLSGPEQKLFRRLSVFTGGWTVEAAEVVTVGECVMAEEVVHLLSRLVDKSLVVVGSELGGTVRYRMLEPIRQYSHHQLVVAGEEATAHRQHADYYLALAEQAVPELQRPNQVEWLDRLEGEHDNFRAALGWLLEQVDADRAVRLGWLLFWLWWTHGHYSEGQRWMERALGTAGELSDVGRARALWVEGYLAFGQGDFAKARPRLQASHDGFQRVGDKAGMSLALGGLAFITMFEGDISLASSLLESSLELAREVGDRHWEALLLSGLAIGARNGGDLQTAMQLDETCLSIMREIGHRPGGVAYALMCLGNDKLAMGDYGGAVTLLEESLRLFRQMGERSVIADTLELLGWAVMMQGDQQRARDLFTEWMELSRELGIVWIPPIAIRSTGWAALSEGKCQEAQSLFAESLKLSREQGAPIEINETLRALASVTATQGDDKRSVVLFASVDAAGPSPRAEWWPERVLSRRSLALARARLGEDAFQRAWLEGEVMPADQAIELALIASARVTNTPSSVEEPVTHAKSARLSPREAQVARLLAQGLTNHQIADDLTLSERTVENHVSSILRKLDLRSRSQAAVWAAHHLLSASN